MRIGPPKHPNFELANGGEQVASLDAQNSSVNERRERRSFAIISLRSIPDEAVYEVSDDDEPSERARQAS